MKHADAAEAARASLQEFVRQAWHIVEPATPLVWNWHLDAIVEHLEAVTRGEIRKLVINVPPGSMKSLMTCVFWPAWVWTKTPEWRALFASYAEGLALRDSVKMRVVVESDWYQEGFVRGAWGLSGDQNVKSFYENTRRGFRIATSVGGKATGLRGDAIVIDDPLNAMDAYSKTKRDECLRWWDQSMGNRLSDLRTGARVLIMQRLHEEDLTGHVLAEGGWDHLCLPTQFEPLRRASTSIGWKDPRTAESELLFPELFPETVIAGERARLGSIGFAGQHQQRPTAAEGGILKRANWKYLRSPVDLRTATPRQVREALGLTSIVQSWDTAHTTKTQNDLNSCHTFGVAKNRYISLDVFTERMEYPELKRSVQQKYDRWLPDVVLVEDKAAGLPLVQELQRETRIPFLLVTPVGDKVARAHAISAAHEAGLFWLPEGEPWVDGFVESCAGFPGLAHDDDVDAFTQGGSYLLRGSSREYAYTPVATTRGPANRNPMRPPEPEPKRAVHTTSGIRGARGGIL